jgi:hypothetical protein
LRCTVSWLQQNISAQEFARWQVWMDAHRVGPGWAALRHAELLAATHNGAVLKQDKRPFTAADFMPHDPWAPPPPPPEVCSAQAMAAQLAALRGADA